MRILVAPSGLKESVEPIEAVKQITKGIKKVFPAADIFGIPFVDGGEGTTRALTKLTNGILLKTRVTGPIGKSVDSYIGILGKQKPKTAIIEIAAAAGLKLVPSKYRNPLLTTSYGVGELIRFALDNHVQEILIGCGDSGTNDGGIGMAQALGAVFKDKEGNSIKLGGSEIHKLDSIDLSRLDPRIRHVNIHVALNINNILTGRKGVAQVFGPQKGANEAQVDKMSKAMDHLAKIVKQDIGIDVALMPGGGASGGLGAGLHAFLGATLHSRYDVINQFTGLDKILPITDLIVTAEGSIDSQTPNGKVPAFLASKAKKFNIPVVVLVGTIGKGAKKNYKTGISAYESILSEPISLEEAIHNGSSLLEDAAERLMRAIKIGISLNIFSQQTGFIKSRRNP